VCQGDPGRPSEDPAPWSIASVPGWTQADASARELEAWLGGVGVFNHVLHDSIGAEPDGQVTYANGDLTGPAQSCAGVVAAHSLGYPILVVLGGDRGDDFLAQATADESRAALVASLLDFIDTYGYDGVDLAWIGGEVVPDQLGALIDDLAAAFSERTPRPLLTVDVAAGLIDPYLSASWAGEVDAINLMSYEADWEEEIMLHLDAGVLPELANVGIGLSVNDLSPTDVAAKIDRVRGAGLGGVESWELGALAEPGDPRLDAYAPLFE
jgi:hypothetical protein